MSRKTQLAATITRFLFAVCILPGAVMNIVQPQILIDMSATLGVPLSLMRLVGMWKILGALALSVPGYPRLREAAYAGFFFDLTGAVYLHVAVGDFAGSLGALLLTGLLVTSYVLRAKAEGARPAA